MSQIIQIVSAFIRHMFLQKPRAEHEQIHQAPSNKPKLYDEIRVKGLAYDYQAEKLILDSIYSGAISNKSCFMIHFAGHSSWDAVIQYLTRGTDANSTFILDKDGKSIRTLNSINNPSYTAWLPNENKGGFLNKDYKIVRQVNNFTVSVEMIGVYGDVWSTEQYEKIAVWIWHMMETCLDFRIWFVCGHEHQNPSGRNDPGKTFDWKFLFCDLLGVDFDFYQEYLSYLSLSAEIDGTRNDGAAKRKLFFIREALEKIATDLKGKSKKTGLL